MASAETDDTAPSFVARIGLAVANPRWALAVAGDRRHAGRSGSDLIAMIVVLLVATRLRPLVERIWIGIEVGMGQGMRGVIHVLTRTLVLDLAILIIGALLLWLLAGKRRNAGRAFDLACVAVLPLFFVEIGATFVIRALDVRVPFVAAWVLSLVAWAWTGALFALAVRTARSGGATVPGRSPARIPGDAYPELASPVTRIARRAGAGVLAVAAIACVLQAVWIVRNVELVRPVDRDMPAPQFALPAIIDETGKLGPVVELAASRGKITIIDFWATWCGPCIKSLPQLDKLARLDDVEVLAINLDDRAVAFKLFAHHKYQMTLLADDGTVSERYGVAEIPHTVVIDRDGRVRHVARGEALETVIRMVEQIRK